MVTIENDCLSVQISELGATLQSVFGKEEGIEYLWQGDKTYWGGRAPILFPFVGRLFEERYTWQGKSYPQKCHGFLRNLPLTPLQTAPDSCTFLLADTEDTYAVYPFRFQAAVTYTLSGKTLKMSFRVDNRGSEAMYFTMGGHPGFNLPLEDGLRFEDYAMVFPEACNPEVIQFSTGVLPIGRAPYALDGGRSLPLRHDLFHLDAVVLTGIPRSVTLKSEKGSHGVTVDFPGMPYVGFWHAPQKECPYVCIEPWCALPGRQDVVEDLTTMPDLTALDAGGTWENNWSITVF